MIEQIMSSIGMGMVHRELDLGEQHADALMMALFQRANERASRGGGGRGLMGTARVLGEIMHVKMRPASVKVGPAHVSYHSLRSLMQFMVVGDLAKLVIFHEGDLPEKVQDLIDNAHLKRDVYDKNVVRLTVQSNSVMFHSWQQIYMLIRGSHNACLHLTDSALKYGDLLWCDHLADKNPKRVELAVAEAEKDPLTTDDMLCEAGWLTANLKGKRMVGGNFMMVREGAFPDLDFPGDVYVTDIGDLENRFTTKHYVEVEPVSYHEYESPHNSVSYTRLSNGQRIDIKKLLFVREQIPDCRMLGHTSDEGTFRSEDNPIFFADSGDSVVAFITTQSLPDLRYYT